MGCGALCNIDVLMNMAFIRCCCTNLDRGGGAAQPEQQRQKLVLWQESGVCVCVWVCDSQGHVSTT